MLVKLRKPVQVDDVQVRVESLEDGTYVVQQMGAEEVEDRDGAQWMPISGLHETFEEARAFVQGYVARAMRPSGRTSEDEEEEEDEG